MSNIDTTPSSVATSALRDLPFGNIIGGPLKACIEAQAQAALTTYKFINEVGLNVDEEGNKSLVYVTFSYRRNGRECTVNVPLLTIVPIPYIAIRDIDIAFKAKIAASSAASDTKKTSEALNVDSKTKVSYNSWVVNASTELNVGYSSKKDSSATRDSKYSVEYTMDVAVKAGQEDMPAGMAKVLEMLNESVDTVETGGELNVSSTVVDLRAADGMPGVYVTYKGEDGFFKNKKDEIGLTLQKMSDTGSALVNVSDQICKITEDDMGFVFMFQKGKNAAGRYIIQAGTKEGKERKAQITVIE